jgi:hypothetical protein
MDLTKLVINGPKLWRSGPRHSFCTNCRTFPLNTTDVPYSGHSNDMMIIVVMHSQIRGEDTHTHHSAKHRDTAMAPHHLRLSPVSN